MTTLPDEGSCAGRAHAQEEKTLVALCRAAWKQGLMAGFNGNASLICAARPGYCLVTCSGSPKGRLGKNDFCLARISDGAWRPSPGQRQPSSELGVHLAIYRGSMARAILHSHPPALLAMEIAGGRLEDLPLFEAAFWSRRLAHVPRLAPGSAELAEVCAELAAQAAGGASESGGGALWLSGHGLCAFGENAQWALALTEQLEHLAGIWLAAKKSG